MDGTLVDSVAGVTAAWELFARKYPGKDVNVEEILSCGFFLSFTFGAYNHHGS
jgi:beta-phosphoglucomutase-like phosphatase (HAD superfamily)